MTRWFFVSPRTGVWYWERTRKINGADHVDKGQPFASRRDCIEDAIVNHGFRVQDCWDVPGRESAYVEVLSCSAGAHCLDRVGLKPDFALPVDATALDGNVLYVKSRHGHGAALRIAYLGRIVNRARYPDWRR